MSDIRAYVLWKIKEGATLEKENLTYFAPGGYIFTHKSGANICFDFEESASKFIAEDTLLECNHRYLDSEFITDSLENNKLNELIQDEYDFNFFQDGFIDLSNPDEMNEMSLCIDVMINGSIQEDYDETKVMEPVYMEIYDASNPDNIAELYNKLTPEEYDKYIKSDTNGINTAKATAKSTTNKSIRELTEEDLKKIRNEVYSDFLKCQSNSDLISYINDNFLGYKIVEVNGRVLLYDGVKKKYETYFAGAEEEIAYLLSKLSKLEEETEYANSRLKQLKLETNK